MSIETTVRALAARATISKEDVRAYLQKDHEEALELAQQMHEAQEAAARKTFLSQLKPATYRAFPGRGKRGLQSLTQFAIASLKGLWQRRALLNIHWSMIFWNV